MSHFTNESVPYWRVRPTPFYATVFLGGTYTADIMGCNLTCQGCWSKYGWHGADEQDIPRGKGGGVFSPEQIVDKLLAGMERNGMPCARISGGEASLYWRPHMSRVIEYFIERTSARRLVVEGKTPPFGDPMALMIETHGAILTIKDLAKLESLYGEDARRIVMSIGVKATNPQLLAKLTGQTPGTAKRDHDHRMEIVQWLALKSEHLSWFANYLDPYVDADELAVLQRKLERKRPGAARLIGSGPIFGHYGDTNTRYTPKRFRTRLEEGDGR